MANINDVFQSDWLKAVDLKGRKVTLTIATEAIEVGKDFKTQQPKDVLILTFVGSEKKFQVNPTNGKAIAKLHGDETKNWVGKKIALLPSKQNIGGEIKDVIFVDAPEETAAPAATPVAPAPVAAPEPEVGVEGIPF